MPDQPHSREQPLPTGDESDWGRDEIDAAIAALDQATRHFTLQVSAPQGSRSRPQPQPRERASQGPEPISEDRPASAAATKPQLRLDPEAALEERMQSAEREAREYLDRAKHRADSLVNTMIGAVEREAAEIRREAETGIRERWRAIELEASRYLEDAKRVADSMVVERQQRISALSDGLVDRARVLTAGMEDADRIRRQFDQFIRTLSQTAAQIAEQPAGGVEGKITRPQGRRGGARRSAVAA